MIGQEILRLPEIPEGTPEVQLRAIRSYLYRLAEQLQYLLATEQEERLRGQDVCSQEAFRSIQKRLLETPQTVQQLTNLTTRQMGDKYVSADLLEAFLQREGGLARDTVYRLARLEDGGKEPEHADREYLCTVPCPGSTRQEGQTVTFRPFPPEGESPWLQVGNGHWQIP